MGHYLKQMLYGQVHRKLSIEGVVRLMKCIGAILSNNAMVQVTTANIKGSQLNCTRQDDHTY